MDPSLSIYLGSDFAVLGSNAPDIPFSVPEDLLGGFPDAVRHLLIVLCFFLPAQLLRQ